EKDMKLIMDAIVAIRNIRAEMGVPLNKKCHVLFSAAKQSDINTITQNENYLKALAGIEALEIGKKLKRPHGSAGAVLEAAEIFVPLAGLIDAEVEKKRISSKIEELSGELKKTSTRVKNKEFVKKAPREVVEKEKEKAKVLSESLKKLENNLKQLL
ncbi:MAG: valine--tRNA ligase, partial [Candidatus Omnitrophota bacterium]